MGKPGGRLPLYRSCTAGNLSRADGYPYDVSWTDSGGGLTVSRGYPVSPDEPCVRTLRRPTWCEVTRSQLAIGEIGRGKPSDIRISAIHRCGCPWRSRGGG